MLKRKLVYGINSADKLNAFLLRNKLTRSDIVSLTEHKGWVTLWYWKG